MNRKKIENHNRNGATPHVGEAAPVFSRKKRKAGVRLLFDNDKCHHVILSLPTKYE
jgi:hypothetical protein